jgi:hypothetical protein
VRAALAVAKTRKNPRKSHPSPCTLQKKPYFMGCFRHGGGISNPGDGKPDRSSSIPIAM